MFGCVRLASLARRRASHRHRRISGQMRHSKCFAWSLGAMLRRDPFMQSTPRTNSLSSLPREFKVGLLVLDGQGSHNAISMIAPSVPESTLTPQWACTLVTSPAASLQSPLKRDNRFPIATSPGRSHRLSSVLRSLQDPMCRVRRRHRCHRRFIDEAEGLELPPQEMVDVHQ